MKKNNLFKFAILLLTSFNAFIFAEKDIEIPEIKFDKFILDNGLTVVVHEDRKISNGCCKCLVSRWFKK